MLHHFVGHEVRTADVLETARSVGVFQERRGKKGKTGSAKITQILDHTLQHNCVLHTCKCKTKDVQIHTNLYIVKRSVMYKYMNTHLYLNM